MDKLDTYAAKTRAYMATDEGRKAWYRNRRELHFDDDANYALAAMTTCHLRKYETITAVVERIKGR